METSKVTLRFRGRDDSPELELICFDEWKVTRELKGRTISRGAPDDNGIAQRKIESERRCQKNPTEALQEVLKTGTVE